MRLYLRRVIGLKELSIIIIVDLDILSNITMCSHNIWGWRWRLQLTRVRQWDICPGLFQGRPFRSTISSSSLFIHMQLFGIDQKIVCRGTRAAGDLAGKPQSICWASRSQFICWILASSSSAGSSCGIGWSSASSLLIRSSSLQFHVARGVSS